MQMLVEQVESSAQRGLDSTLGLLFWAAEADDRALAVGSVADAGDGVAFLLPKPPPSPLPGRVASPADRATNLRAPSIESAAECGEPPQNRRGMEGSAKSPVCYGPALIKCCRSA